MNSSKTDRNSSSLANIPQASKHPDNTISLPNGRYHACILCEALLPSSLNLHQHLVTAHHVSESCVNDVIFLSKNQDLNGNLVGDRQVDKPDCSSFRPSISQLHNADISTNRKDTISTGDLRSVLNVSKNASTLTLDSSSSCENRRIVQASKPLVYEKRCNTDTDNMNCDMTTLVTPDETCQPPDLAAAELAVRQTDDFATQSAITPQLLKHCINTIFSVQDGSECKEHILGPDSLARKPISLLTSRVLNLNKLNVQQISQLIKITSAKVNDSEASQLNLQSSVDPLSRSITNNSSEIASISSMPDSKQHKLLLTREGYYRSALQSAHQRLQLVLDHIITRNSEVLPLDDVTKSAFQILDEIVGQIADGDAESISDFPEYFDYVGYSSPPWITSSTKEMNCHFDRMKMGPSYLSPDSKDASGGPQSSLFRPYSIECDVNEYDDCSRSGSCDKSPNHALRHSTSRTNIMPDQHDILFRWFRQDNTPSKSTLEFIANEVKLPKRVVQVWFQNTRARERRNVTAGLSDKSGTSPDEGFSKCRNATNSNGKLSPNRADAYFGRMNSSFVTSNSSHTKMDDENTPARIFMGASGDHCSSSSPFILPKPNSHNETFDGIPNKCISSVLSSTLVSRESQIPCSQNVQGFIKGTDNPPLCQPAVTGNWKKCVDSDFFPKDVRVDAPTQRDTFSSCTSSIINRYNFPNNNISNVSMPDILNAGKSFRSSEIRHTVGTESNGILNGHRLSSGMHCSSGSNRRFRTQMTSLQVRIMKAIFIDYKTPTMPECEALGREIGLQKRVVQVWFQNARAKEKKNPNHIRDEVGCILGRDTLAGYDAASYGPASVSGCDLCSIRYDGLTHVQRDHLFSARHINSLRECFNGGCQTNNLKDLSSCMSLKNMESCNLNLFPLSAPSSSEPSVSIKLEPTETAMKLERPNSPTSMGGHALSSDVNSVMPPECNARMGPSNGISLPSSNKSRLHQSTVSTSSADKNDKCAVPRPHYSPDVYGTPLRLLRIPLLGLSHISKMIQENETLAQYTEDSSSSDEIVRMGFKIHPVTITVGYVCKICHLAWPDYKSCIRHVLAGHRPPPINDRNFENKVARYDCDRSPSPSNINMGILKIEQQLHCCEGCGRQFPRLTDVANHKHSEGDKRACSVESSVDAELDRAMPRHQLFDLSIRCESGDATIEGDAKDAIATSAKANENRSITAS